MAEHIDRQGISAAAKAALLDSGILPTLKNNVKVNSARQQADTEGLKQQAEAMAGELQQRMDSGTLDSTKLQQLGSLLARLRSALEGGALSREALAQALSEASGAIASAGGAGTGLEALRKATIFWQQVEQHNHSIHDDFETMRKAGIHFDAELWRKHQSLLEDLQEHPRDIEKQKELNAIDDLLLQQAKAQLEKCPNAQKAFDHAQQESEARHEVVDKKLAKLEQKNKITTIDWDDAPDLTLNDITVPQVGQKPGGKGQSLS